ncbi:hypothetical protein [Streptomyces gilvus]|nr:hypothetical protein [Streptomyces sp. CME 23]
MSSGAKSNALIETTILIGIGLTRLAIDLGELIAKLLTWRRNR